MTNAQDRHERIQTLFNVIKKCEGGAKEHELINQASEAFSVSPAKVSEYIKELKDKGKIINQGALITLNHDQSDQARLF